MTDEEAIEAAKRIGLPIVHLEPTGAIDEITTVDFRGRMPIVSRVPSSDRYPNLQGLLAGS